VEEDQISLVLEIFDNNLFYKEKHRAIPVHSKLFPIDNSLLRFVKWNNILLLMITYSFSFILLAAELLLNFLVFLLINY
jgi:hypothetical protein